MESLQLLVVAFLAGCITAATLVLALHAATDPGRDSTQMRRRQPDKAPATTVAIVLPPARPAAAIRRILEQAQMRIASACATPARKQAA